MLPAILHVMTPFMGTVTPDSNPWQYTNKTLVKKSGTLSTNLSAMICGKYTQFLVRRTIFGPEASASLGYGLVRKRLTYQPSPAGNE